jgi:hypothetical protein
MPFTQKDIIHLTGGLNKASRTDAIDEAQVTGLENVRLWKNNIEADTGYASLPNSEVGVDITGAPRRIYELKKLDGSEELLLFTDSNVYSYNTSTTNWDVIAHSTSVVERGAGNSVSLLGINGLATKQVNIATYGPSDQVIFTNGVDPVMSYIPTASGGTGKIEYLDGMGGQGSDPLFNTCLDIQFWHDRIFLFNTTESGTAIPQGVRWSDVANPTVWEILATNDAGFLNMYNSEDQIIKTAELSGNMIVYRTNSIARLEWIGSANQTVRAAEMIPNEGILASNAVAVVNDYHVIVGKSNIYRYTGGISLEPMGQEIYPLIYGAESLLALSRGYEIFAKFIQTLQEFWISIPTGSEALGITTTIFRYSTVNQSWSMRKFEDHVTYFDEESFAPIDGWDTGSAESWIAGPDTAWHSYLFSDSFPTILMAGDGDIFNYDRVTLTDNTNPMPWFVETKEFTNGTKLLRTDFVECEVSGGPITAEYQTSEQTSWTSIGTFPVNASPKNERLYFQTTSRGFKLRFSGSSDGAKIGALSFSFQDESSY